MKNIKWVLLIVVLVVIVFIAFQLNKPKEEKKTEKRSKGNIKVEALIVKPSVLINNITVSGTILPFEEVDLKNEVAGRVVKINLPEGKTVKEGTLLVKLFDDDLQADLKKLQTQLAIQQQIYDRQSELMKVNGISQNDYEQTGLQLNSLKAQIEVQKVQIRKTEVLAPFSGVIGLRNISIGAQVTTSTTLATIRKVDKLKLDFSIPEKYSAGIVPGMKIKFSLFDKDKTYDATVMASEYGIDASTRNLKIRAEIDSKSEQLIPGSFCTVTLEMNKNNKAIQIPSKAIIPQDVNKMVIVADSGKAHFVEVKTGIRNASLVEITDGIKPGDTVITTGILFLKEGSKLSYSKIKTGAK
jgi:membrane fusion protein, multidrug efflux system